MFDRLLREILYGVLVRRCFFVLLIGARDFFYFDFVPNNAKNFRGFVFSSVFLVTLDEWFYSNIEDYGCL